MPANKFITKKVIFSIAWRYTSSEIKVEIYNYLMNYIRIFWPETIGKTHVLSVEAERKVFYVC